MTAALPSVAAGTSGAWTDVVASSHEVLQVHARSFRWASVFLPPSQRDDAAVVYALCRLIDDLADERTEETAAAQAHGARQDLDVLADELHGRTTARPLVRAFLDVVARRSIPLSAVDHLVEGVLGDLGAVRLADDGELLRYCYRVAGTVGLMMVGVLGVHDADAVPHAVDLGVAMQLSNICRDVREDAERDRVYLPADRLARVDLDPQHLVAAPAGAPPPDVSAVVTDLLAMAERYYDSGLAGLDAIPARPRLAIHVAATLYREVGRKLLAHGADPMLGRTIVGPARKAWLVLRAGAAWAWGLVRAPARPPHQDGLHTALAGLPGAVSPSSPAQVR